MGQKVNPNGIRVGIIKNCTSTWYANKKHYAGYLNKDIKVREYLRKQLAGAGVSRIEIARLAKTAARVKVHAARPGVIIGKKGNEVDVLRRNLAVIMGVPVNITIEEIKKPELDASLVAESIAGQLVRRVMFRKAMKRAVQSALRAGAEGIKVCVSGRLGGAEIARVEWYREGRVPLHTFRADIDYGVAEANTTYGIIGVKIWIFKGEVLSKESEEQLNTKKNTED